MRLKEPTPTACATANRAPCSRNKRRPWPLCRAWLEITRRNGEAVRIPDGAVSDDGRVWGCYLHGLFANDKLRRAWLSSLGPRYAVGAGRGAPISVHQALDRLADAVENVLDMPMLDTIVNRGVQR